ncbi:MAG: hypothetical protein Q8K79_22690 [Solirubrobacteraceae bacterium]|nr:hypothetical protein [Solirubrobacteraceae bacterium]
MDLRSKSEPAEVERAVRAALPDPATPADVHSLARSSGFECSDLVEGGVIHCSAKARSRMPFVSGKWLLRFFFEDEKLARIEVEKGLTGP